MISHLALIMDGNRRWAKKRALFPWQGHREGAKTVEMVIEFCIKKKIQFLSLYTFSLENLNRSEKEKKYLFDLIDTMRDRVDEFIKHDVRIHFSGDRTEMDEHIRSVCDEVEQATKKCKTLRCNLLFFYGGRQEIIAAARELQKQNIEITEEQLRKQLWTGDIPDPELVIRTGQRYRLSNFLLFQIAYSEIHFLDLLWPDLTEQDLENAVEKWKCVQKNFGT